MEIINGISKFREIYSGEIVLALGNFDGVHLGHRAIIEDAIMAARDRNGRSAVLVFSPHPLSVLSPERSPALIITINDRIRLLGEAGIDYVIVHPFTREFAALTPTAFAGEILCGTLAVSGVVVGFDYTFGRYGSGSATDMQHLGRQLGFAVRVVEPVEVNGMPVGSTRIRTFLMMGRVKEAAAMLGYPFYLRGPVVCGDGRGRVLGYPTANVMTPCEVIQPGHGVYLTRVLLDSGSQAFWGVTNVGKRPTFCPGKPTVEVHLLDFAKNLYGQELTVQFLQKIRDEKAFSGPAELAEQIKKDILQARELIRSYA